MFDIPRFSRQKSISGHKLFKKETLAEPVTVLRDHHATVKTIAVHKQSLVTAGNDKMIFVYYAKSAERVILRYRVKAHSDWISAVSLNCRYLLSVSLDSTLKIWDSSIGVLVSQVDHSISVTCLRANNQFIVTGAVIYQKINLSILFWSNFLI